MKPIGRIIMKKIVVFGGWLLAGALGAGAADFHATTAQELQNALTLAAANGSADTIYLAAGYYTGNFNFNSAEAYALAIQGEAGTDRTQITIDGAGTGRSLAISCSAAANVTVSGITILRNCGAAANAGLRVSTAGADILVQGCRFLAPINKYGTGIEVAAARDVNIRDCAFTGNGNSGCGKGIGISGATRDIKVEACAFANNSWNGRGGLDISGGASASVSNNTFSGNNCGACIANATTMTMNNNTFSGNSNAYGGGADIDCTTVTINNNTFSGNSANDGGGANVSGTTVTMNNNTFSGNSANDGGGAFVNGTTMVLNSNTFSGNSTDYWMGGGVYVIGMTVTMNNNTFIGNSVVGEGGGGAYVKTATATLSGNLFRQNQAASSLGGGLCYTNSSGQLRLFNNVFSLNSAASGGGLWMKASTNTMVNNTVTENSAANGGGAFFQVDGVVEKIYVYNNIVWGNTATANGGDVYLAGTGSRKEFQYNDAHGMYGVWDIATSNLDVAPLFFDPVNGNYHLRNTSPCINRGYNSATNIPATDADGELRIQNVTVDMGAYEFSNTDRHPADLNDDWSISESEYNAYAAAWKNDQAWARQPSPIPADYATRAGYIKANGGNYYNDGGGGKPLCWKPGTAP